MAEELTKTLTVRRRKSPKSGYSITKEEDAYILDTISSKAQASVNLGDRVIAINGIPSEEFLDEEDANNLIECIRIVVIPRDNIEKYDNDDVSEESEDDYEEYDRNSRKQPKPSSTHSRAIVAVKEPKKTVGIDIFCQQCDYNNMRCIPDDDGDYVCEECGYVIEPPTAAESHHKCIHCGYDNINLEKDDEDDYVCQECGHVIPDNTNVEVRKLLVCLHFICSSSLAPILLLGFVDRRIHTFSYFLFFILIIGIFLLMSNIRIPFRNK